MLSDAEKEVLKNYQEAATLSRDQVADYFRLLKKAEEPEPEPVQVPKKKYGRK